MEHAMFFAMMMPGPELATQRGQAEDFQRRFAAHLTRLKGSSLNTGNYAAFNTSTIALTQSLVAYKQAMEDAQASGRMHSLVWPKFFDHTREEAVRFVSRLQQLNSGNTNYVRSEVIPFWADKMEEHHNVRILDEAIVECVKLSHRYITGRQLPDKSVSVLDTACAKVAIGQGATPGPVEDATRRIQHLTSEIEALEREQVTGAGQRESHVHDVQITKEPPNYRAG